MDKNLYQFPHYETPEEYRAATGKDAPAWDMTKPRKYWVDAKAKASARRLLVYEVLALNPNGSPATDERGKPYVVPLVLTKEDAAEPNIPPTNWTQKLNPVMNTASVPRPLRPLAQGEWLDFEPGPAGSFGSVLIFQPGDAVSDPAVATLEVLALVRKIWRKLGGD